MLAGVRLIVYLFQTETWKIQQITVNQGKEVLGKHDGNFGNIIKGRWCGTIHQTSPFQIQNSVNMQYNQQRGLNMNFEEEATVSHINWGMWSIFITKDWLLLALQAPGAHVSIRTTEESGDVLKLGRPGSATFSSKQHGWIRLDRNPILKCNIYI